MSTKLIPAASGLPAYFMGGTVISFTSSIGFGSQQESTLNIDLVEDCNAIVGDCLQDQNITTSGVIGSPQYFTVGNFTFGGIITSWTKSKNMSGEVYNFKLTDPRQLLENVTIIVDTVRSPTDPYLELPGGSTFWNISTVLGINYFNVYAWYEDRLRITNDPSAGAAPGQVLVDKCGSFGDSYSNADSQGMPYYRIIQALSPSPIGLASPIGVGPEIYYKSKENITYPFEVDLSTLPTNLPDYYRVPGPSITLLELVQNVCDVLGYDFYVYMEKLPHPEEGVPDRNIIKFGLVDLKEEPESFSNIITNFDGKALDISFGEELRNDTTRSMVIGEYVHKLIYVDKFMPYFGQDRDPFNLRLRPVIPFFFDTHGFWIAKNVDDLNSKLLDPCFTQGALYSIHELDIRCAMASFNAWFFRTMSSSTPGTFNFSIRNQYSSCVINNPEWIKTRITSSEEQLGILKMSLYRNIQDLYQNPITPFAVINRPDLLNDLETIHQWLANLGNNYYGKQYLVPITDRICSKKLSYTIGDLNDEGNSIHSHQPTNAGGWVDPGITVLDLQDPELETFRTIDGRIKCFAIFKTDGEVQNAGVE